MNTPEDITLRKQINDVLLKIEAGSQLHNENIVREALDTDAIHIDAYQAIQSIIDDDELVEVGGQGAKRHFEIELKNIATKMKNKQVLQEQIKHPRYDDSAISDFDNFYLRFCIANKLFLNFHIHDHTCEAALSDPIYISITTPIDDTTTFYSLARYINQIKEDYAIWVKDKKKDLSIREEILKAENISLYALYDIFRDFLSGYYTEMKDIRRALTHRQLTIFELVSGEANTDGELVSITLNEMINQTIQLMRLVKAA